MRERSARIGLIFLVFYLLLDDLLPPEVEWPFLRSDLLLPILFSAVLEICIEKLFRGFLDPSESPGETRMLAQRIEAETNSASTPSSAYDSQFASLCLCEPHWHFSSANRSPLFPRDETPPQDRVPAIRELREELQSLRQQSVSIDTFRT